MEAASVVRSLAKPKVVASRSVGFSAVELEPDIVAATIQGAREARNVVDLSLEMLDVSALDTGEYQAMVIQDPTDKRNIRGYFHFARVYCQSLRQAELSTSGQTETHNIDIRSKFAVRRLIEFVSEHTDIQVDIAGEYSLDSRELFKTPWVYVGGYFMFKMPDAEAYNMGTYMLSGGLVFADIYHLNPPNEIVARRSMINMLKDATAAVGVMFGRDWSFERIPNEHGIYHCYYDFNSGPPLGGDYLITVEGGHNPEQFVDYLEAINLQGRMVAILCDKWYGNPWGDWGRTTGPSTWFAEYKSKDPTRALQMGTNFIVFALTQEGSITNQVMNAVNY